MQLKKNPKADLTKNSSLYFAIGLAVSFINFMAEPLNGKLMKKQDMVMNH